MFFQKASDPVEEAMVAEVTVAGAPAEHLQDHRGPAPLHHQGLTAVRYAQPPGLLDKAAAEATAVVPLVHHERVQHGRAVRCGKNRAR